MTAHTRREEGQQLVRNPPHARRLLPLHSSAPSARARLAGSRSPASWEGRRKPKFHSCTACEAWTRTTWAAGRQLWVARSPPGTAPVSQGLLVPAGAAGGTSEAWGGAAAEEPQLQLQEVVGTPKGTFCSSGTSGAGCAGRQAPRRCRLPDSPLAPVVSGRLTRGRDQAEASVAGTRTAGWARKVALPACRSLQPRCARGLPAGGRFPL